MYLKDKLKIELDSINRLIANLNDNKNIDDSKRYENLTIYIRIAIEEIKKLYKID